MRVLHVLASIAPRYGGPSSTVPEMAAALARRGHEVELVTTNLDGDGELDVEVGIPVERDRVRTTVFQVGQPRSYARSAGLARWLRRHLRSFDLVHVHALYLFHTLVACGLARRHGVPYALAPHGVLDSYHQRHNNVRKSVYNVLVEKRNLRGAAVVHVASAFERREAAAAGVETPIAVVPYGVNIARFESPGDMTPLRAAHPELDGRRLITFVGRLAQKKRIDLLLEAMPAVLTRHPDVHLVIAGPEEGRGASARRQVGRLGLGDRVSFVGLVDGPVKVGLLQASSIFAHPSDDESFCVSIAEAMAAGIPALTTDRVGIADELAAAGGGLVVEKTPDGIAEGLLKLLDDPAYAESCGQRGRAAARAAFDWDVVGAELENLYADVLGGKHAK